MRPRRAALLTPPSPTPAFLQNVANSCICHTSEKSPVTPIIATDPKTRSRKSCVCHTCDPLPPPPFHLLLLFLRSPRVTHHFRRPSFVGANLPLCFQALVGCSPRNPFLFMFLHGCPGVVGGQAWKASSRPHKVLFQESLHSLSTFVPRIRRSRARGFSYFPPVTSHESPGTSLVLLGFPRSSGAVSCELSAVDSANSCRMRSYKKSGGLT